VLLQLVLALLPDSVLLLLLFGIIFSVDVAFVGGTWLLIF